MKLNAHEEELIGQTDSATAHKPTAQSVAASAVAAVSTLSTSEDASGAESTKGKRKNPCPRFGEHDADSHRVDEILGGAFHD
jgi:hypothetical protein